MLHKSQNDKKVTVSACSVGATEDFIAQSPSEICVHNCRNLQQYRFYKLYLMILGIQPHFGEHRVSGTTAPELQSDSR